MRKSLLLFVSLVSVLFLSSCCNCSKQSSISNVMLNDSRVCKGESGNQVEIQGWIIKTPYKCKELLNDLAMNYSVNEFNELRNCLSKNEAVKIQAFPKVIVLSGESAAMHITKDETKVLDIKKDEEGIFDLFEDVVSLGYKIDIKPEIADNNNVKIKYSFDANVIGETGKLSFADDSVDYSAISKTSIESEFFVKSNNYYYVRFNDRNDICMLFIKPSIKSETGGNKVAILKK